MRTLLLLVTLLCVAMAISSVWFRNQHAQAKFEDALLDYPKFQRISNTDYELDCILPKWLQFLVGEDNLDPFFRVTKIDFVLENLNSQPTEDIEFYNQFKSVHTIRISNTKLSARVSEALQTFPSLKRIVLLPTNWGDDGIEPAEKNNSIDLTTYDGNEFEILVETENSPTFW